MDRADTVTREGVVIETHLVIEMGGGTDHSVLSTQPRKRQKQLEGMYG